MLKSFSAHILSLSYISSQDLLHTLFAFEEPDVSQTTQGFAFFCWKMLMDRQPCLLLAHTARH